VEQPGRLFLHGLNHARMAVAGIGHADTAGKVQVSRTGRVIKVATLAAFYDNIR
jgi:hypothetical protein